jgi:hypothetical protein
MPYRNNLEAAQAALEKERKHKIIKVCPKKNKKLEKALDAKPSPIVTIIKMIIIFIVFIIPLLNYCLNN